MQTSQLGNCFKKLTCAKYGDKALYVINPISTRTWGKKKCLQKYGSILINLNHSRFYKAIHTTCSTSTAQSRVQIWSTSLAHLMRTNVNPLSSLTIMTYAPWFYSSKQNQLHERTHLWYSWVFPQTHFKSLTSYSSVQILALYTLSCSLPVSAANSSSLKSSTGDGLCLGVSGWSFASFCRTSGFPDIWGS